MREARTVNYLSEALFFVVRRYLSRLSKLNRSRTLKMRRDLNLNTVTLWAMWKQTIQIMQNWTGCSSLEQEETITMKDNRDGNLYTVSRLKDDKCWMTQNLRIAGLSISSSDSDMTSGTFQIPASSRTLNWANAQSSPRNTIYAVYVDESHGGFYTLSTVILGQIGDGRGLSQVSICPKSWHLPSSAEGNKIISLYGSNITNPPFNFDATYFSGNSIMESNGAYWLSDRSGNGSNCIASSLFYVGSAGGGVCGYTGYQVRCVQ